MYLQKKTRPGKNIQLVSLAIKLLAIILFVLILTVIIDRIDLPAPHKKIEKIISNEKFKIVK
jgi:hypothetical protein